MLKKIAFFTVLIAVLSVFVFLFYYERQSFSEADLRFEIIGPSDVKVGEIVEYRVKYRNNSDTRLEKTSVVFEYPEASVPIQENGDFFDGENLRRKIDLEDINPGQEEIVDFKAMILGEEGDTVKAVAWFNYSPQNLSANYEAERSHTTVITSVPINFELDLPGQIESDEEFSFRIRYFSQLNYDLDNLGVRINYPSGFQFIRSIPSGMEKDKWEREVLPKNEGGVIEIFGKLNGDPGDIKGFSAELGVWKYDRFTVLKKTNSEVLIPRLNLFIDVLINDSVDYMAKSGEDLLYEIYFKNIGDQILENLFLTVDLDKEILNMDEVESMGGRFQKDVGTILWNHSSFPTLRRLRPGEEEKLSFWAKVKEDLPYNPEIRILVNLNEIRHEVRTRVGTEIDIIQNFALEDPLESIGPLPFIENRANTYTVSWEVKNYYNNLENTKIYASLPQGASLTGKRYPEDEDLIYDSQTGRIIWNLGTLERGSGVSFSAPKLYFQVEIRPSVVEENMTLITPVTISGKDIWTKKDIQSRSDFLTKKDLLNIHNIEFNSGSVELEFEDEEKNNQDN